MKINLKKIDINKALIIAGIVAGILFFIFIFWWRWGWEVNIIGISNEENEPAASLTGLSCNNYSKRPMAIMMASDPETRPLSGISQADLVVEMPVTPSGVTRMMAFFQCEEPEEIGSVRSARQDFITLAKSFGAIYSHWGGEKEALNNLNNSVINNIDAMKYDGTVFYRKKSVPRPHNGFTNIKLISEKADELGYVLSDSFKGYIREDDKPERSLSNLADTVIVDYEKPYNVKWIYDSALNVYKRFRGDEGEIDRNTSKQVEASVVILTHTTSKFLSKDYISVDTIGEGVADFYQNGIVTNGTWKNRADNLKFYNLENKEMEFTPGKMWIEIITN